MMSLTPEAMRVSSSILRSIAHDLAHDLDHDNAAAVDVLHKYSDALWESASLVKKAQNIEDEADSNDCL
jgi:hypothetical protein